MEKREAFGNDEIAAIAASFRAFLKMVNKIGDTKVCLQCGDTYTKKQFENRPKSIPFDLGYCDIGCYYAAIEE